MAWTAPRTWTASEVPSASTMNTHLRDNLNALLWQENSVDTSQTTTSTTYADLTTVGPALTLTTLTSAIVFVSCQMSVNINTTGVFMSYAVSGATTSAAVDDRAVGATLDNVSNSLMQNGRMSRVALTGGSNTFTAKYKTGTGTATFLRRRIMVLGVA